jgi:hypothetical protein
MQGVHRPGGGGVVPYIVTTTRKGWNATVGYPREFAERAAVATLDEAATEVRAKLAEDRTISAADLAPVVDDLYEMPSGGGVFGPLSDGTTITVEPKTWDWVYAAYADLHGPVYVTQAEMLAAFNAAQEAPDGR